MPNHFTLTLLFCCERRDVSCSHSNHDLFTREDNMLFSHVFARKLTWYFIGIYIINYNWGLNESKDSGSDSVKTHGSSEDTRVGDETLVDSSLGYV